MLIMRGARINVMNRGDDTPLHLASSHGHRDIVAKVNTKHTKLLTKANVVLSNGLNVNYSLFSAKQIPILSTNMGTLLCIMPAFGDKTKWQRCT